MDFSEKLMELPSKNDAFKEFFIDKILDEISEGKYSAEEIISKLKNLYPVLNELQDRIKSKFDV